METMKQTPLVTDASFDHDEKLEIVGEEQVDDNLTAYNEKKARELRRRVDYRLIPVLTILYLVSYIDRSNSKSSPHLSLGIDCLT